MEELVYPAIVGSLLPLVISFFKRQQWATQIKKRLSLIICLVAAGAAYFIQHGGWVGWETLVVDFGVIYTLAQTSYLGFWQDTSPEVRLANVGSQLPKVT